MPTIYGTTIANTGSRLMENILRARQEEKAREDEHRWQTEDVDVSSLGIPGLGKVSREVLPYAVNRASTLDERSYNDRPIDLSSWGYPKLTAVPRSLIPVATSHANIVQQHNWNTAPITINTPDGDKFTFSREAIPIMAGLLPGYESHKKVPVPDFLKGRVGGESFLPRNVLIDMYASYFRENSPDALRRRRQWNLENFRNTLPLTVDPIIRNELEPGWEATRDAVEQYDEAQNDSWYDHRAKLLNAAIWQLEPFLKSWPKGLRLPYLKDVQARTAKKKSTFLTRLNAGPIDNEFKKIVDEFEKKTQRKLSDTERQILYDYVKDYYSDLAGKPTLFGTDSILDHLTGTSMMGGQ